MNEYNCWNARRDIEFFFAGAGTKLERDRAYDRLYDHIIGQDAMISCQLCLACWNKHRIQQEQANKACAVIKD